MPLDSPQGDRRLKVAVLGAGPVGVDASLAASAAGFSVKLYEAGSDVGSALREWGHVRLFTPWAMVISPRMRMALEGAGEVVPVGDCPTGLQVAEELLVPVVRAGGLEEHLLLGSRVVQVSRAGLLKNDLIGDASRSRRPFRLLVEAPDGERIDTADLVLDCTGSWTFPNALGNGGIPAVGERELSERVHRRVPDLAVTESFWHGRRVLVVGGGHSAQTAVTQFAELIVGSTTGAQPAPALLWVLRSRWVPSPPADDDPLPARAALTRAVEGVLAGEDPRMRVIQNVVVERISEAEDGSGLLEVELGGAGMSELIKVHDVFALTGSSGDRDLYRELQVHECWATGGPMKLSAALLSSASTDCLTETGHGVDTLRNPEPNFYILGSKSYGRNGAFLLRIGWQQVDDVFESISGATT